VEEKWLRENYPYLEGNVFFYIGKGCKGTRSMMDEKENFLGKISSHILM
jgi:hypothetical protein